MKRHKAFHPRNDIDMKYIEDFIVAKIQEFQKYTESHS